MHCADTAVAAKAQFVPAESRVDGFMRHIEAGWHKWRTKSNRHKQQQAEGEAQQGQEPGQQQQEQQQDQLLLGCYTDTQQWLVDEVLPGLERHTHLAGLLALLRKWTSRKVEGVSAHALPPLLLQAATAGLAQARLMRHPCMLSCCLCYLACVRRTHCASELFAGFSRSTALARVTERYIRHPQ
jgi:hypothetical protein